MGVFFDHVLLLKTHSSNTSPKVNGKRFTVCEGSNMNVFEHYFSHSCPTWIAELIGQKAVSINTAVGRACY